MDIIHGALAFVLLSILYLGMVTSSIVGDSSPMRAFQSPHTVVSVFCGMLPSMSSTKLRATSSSVFLFYKFYIGGMYTFPTQIFDPPYPYIQIPWAYSLPIYFKIFIPFFIITATPPLLPVERRCSYT
jgi:hypothetical protein